MDLHFSDEMTHHPDNPNTDKAQVFVRDEAGPERYRGFLEDDGETWQIGGQAAAQNNGYQVIEHRDGSLLLKMRSNPGRNQRSIGTSIDAGIAWSDATFDETLIEPRCQASLLRYTPHRPSVRRRRAEPR